MADHQNLTPGLLCTAAVRFLAQSWTRATLVLTRFRMQMEDERLPSLLTETHSHFAVSNGDADAVRRSGEGQRQTSV